MFYAEYFVLILYTEISSVIVIQIHRTTQTFLLDL